MKEFFFFFFFFLVSSQAGSETEREAWRGESTSPGFSSSSRSVGWWDWWMVGELR